MSLLLCSFVDRALVRLVEQFCSEGRTSIGDCVEY